MTQPQEPPRLYPATCKAGHALSDDVVYMPGKAKGAKWRCRVCLRAAYAKHYKMKRDARVATGWQPNKNRNMPPLPTHCSNGHLWTPETTYTSPKTSHRQCRLCRRARVNAQRAAIKAARVNSAALTEGAQPG